MEFKTQYGNRNSPKADFFASDVWGKLGVSVEGSAFNTDGFPIVTASERGIIDNNAEVDFRTLNVRADYRANDRVSVFFRGGYFKEDRVNGKINEVNDTKWTAVGGGVRVRMPDDSDFQATLFTDDNTFHSTFLAVTAPSATVPSRSIVRLATDQTVPADAVGTMVQWSRPIGRKHFFSAGFDWRQVDGDSLEDAYIPTPGVPIQPPTAPATLSLRRNSGGTQDSVGFFLQDVFSMNNLVATLSARVDSWKNHDGHIFETSVGTGLPSAGNRGELPDREDTVVSPRGALLYRVSDRVSLWGDVGLGIPGADAQRALSPVRRWTRPHAGEREPRPRASLRRRGRRQTRSRPQRLGPLDVVRQHREGPGVQRHDGTNLQQRQNLGRTRIRGWQNDVEMRIGSSMRVAAGYMFNNAKVTENPANPALVGLYLPQVPKHRGSVSFCVLQSAHRQCRRDRHVLRPPVRRRPQRAHQARRDRARPAGVRGDGLSACRVTSADISTCSSASRTPSMRSTIVMLLPTTTGSPRLVNGGIRVRFNGR